MSIWLNLRLEFDGTNGGAIGPRRANILEAIDRFGSLSAAAPAVDLSFRRVWDTVQLLNRIFGTPLIGIRRSGRSSGAFLTPLGSEFLARVREIQRVANAALESHLRELEKLVGIDSNSPPSIPRFAQIADTSAIPAPKKQRVRRLKVKRKMKRRSVKTKLHFERRR